MQSFRGFSLTFSEDGREAGIPVCGGIGREYDKHAAAGAGYLRTDHSWACCAVSASTHKTQIVFRYCAHLNIFRMLAANRFQHRKSGARSVVDEEGVVLA